MKNNIECEWTLDVSRSEHDAHCLVRPLLPFGLDIIAWRHADKYRWKLHREYEYTILARGNFNTLEIAKIDAENYLMNELKRV